MTDTRSRFQQDAEAVEELTKLLDAIHGPDRQTQGNGTWTFTEDGGEAPLYPAHGRNAYCLHVTTDGEVWLDPDGTRFTGVCIGGADDCIADATVTLERGLERLRAYTIGGR